MHTVGVCSDELQEVRHMQNFMYKGSTLHLSGSTYANTSVSCIPSFSDYVALRSYGLSRALHPALVEYMSSCARLYGSEADSTSLYWDRLQTAKLGGYTSACYVHRVTHLFAYQIMGGLQLLYNQRKKFVQNLFDTQSSFALRGQLS